MLNGPRDVSNAQVHPDVAALAGGGFVIVWELAKNAADHDIFAQRYNAAGAAVGGVSIVQNTFATFDELPSVAGLVDGGFVVALTARTRRPATSPAG